MERIWLQSYPESTPAEIDPSEVVSLVELFQEAAGEFAARPAFTNLGTTLSYARLDGLTNDFAAYLQQHTDLEPGDRIALMMPNLLQYPIALFGSLKAGMTVVNVNPLYTARELRHQLSDAGAKAIVILENFAHVLEPVLADTELETVIVTRVGDMLPWPKSMLIDFIVKHVKKQVPRYDLPDAIGLGAVLNAGARATFHKTDVSLDDVAFLQYTGGTTGLAKGAVLTHRNIASNVVQASRWFGPMLSRGNEIVITALPLYHIFALTANCMAYLRSGALNVLITNPRDLPAFVKTLGRHRFTVITGVNTLFNALLNTPGFSALDFSSLKVTLGGGMAVQRAVAERWQEVTGTTLIEAYGLTETSPAVCINPLDLSSYNGSIGLPLPSTEIKVVAEDGQALAIGESGELCVRGPQVMRGYFNKPEETAATMDDDGWLHTGDIARVDERGFVYIVDRKKDMILVSGFNVYPNEIEDVVADHPEVLEVGAIGVPDEHSGEVVAIVVVRKSSSLQDSALREHCRANLTGYKRPKHIVFVDSLPKSNVGKILRRELREQFAKQLGGEH